MRDYISRISQSSQKKNSEIAKQREWDALRTTELSNFSAEKFVHVILSLSYQDLQVKELLFVQIMMPARNCYAENNRSYTGAPRSALEASSADSSPELAVYRYRLPRG